MVLVDVKQQKTNTVQLSIPSNMLFMYRLNIIIKYLDVCLIYIIEVHTLSLPPFVKGSKIVICTSTTENV